MPPLDPRLDFQDDGGTPAWRARHARVIDLHPPGFRSRIRSLTVKQRLIIGALVGLSPFLMIPIGIVVLIVVGLFTG
jgi:hypothetical protein